MDSSNSNESVNSISTSFLNHLAFGAGLPLNLTVNSADSVSFTVRLSILFTIFAISRSSKAHLFSLLPNSLNALTVYVPTFLSPLFGITKVYLLFDTSFSIRTPSLMVNSFSLKNQDTVGFGLDVTTHSNFVSLSLKLHWFFGTSINTGPALTLSLAIFEVASPIRFVILTL